MNIKGVRIYVYIWSCLRERNEFKQSCSPSNLESVTDNNLGEKVKWYNWRKEKVFKRVQIVYCGILGKLGSASLKLHLNLALKDQAEHGGGWGNGMIGKDDLYQLNV